MVTEQSVKEELFDAVGEIAAEDFISAILSFGGALGKDDKGYYLFYSAHDYRLALILSSYLKHVYSYGAEIEIARPEDKRRKRSFELTIKGKTALSLLSDLGKIRLQNGEIALLDSGLKQKRDSLSNAAAYVSGIFLSCGSLGKAAGGLRLTLAFDTEEYADETANLLLGEGIELKKQEKDGKYYLSSRKGQAISDFFALAGANKAVLQIQEMLVLTEVKNKIQRASNLSAANLDKAVSAAVRQYNDAVYLKSKTSFYGIPSEIAEVAEARIAYKDASLEELRELLPERISKSGLYHRLEKISEMANALREERK